MKKPRLVNEVELLSGLRFKVTRRRYIKDDGYFERDIVVFPEAVVILPFVSREKIMLIRQFRASLNDFIIEAPAGVVDPGESPEETARRELVEEIGYHPNKLFKLGSFMPTPGYSTEILHFYVAEDLEYRGVKPEKYEVIEPMEIDLRQAYEMVLNNEIRDAKTALLILLYMSKKSGCT